MTVRPAGPADVAELRRIEGGLDAGLLWSAEDYLSYNCTLAEIDGRLAGFVLTREVADQEFEILNVVVGLDFRRIGVARTLLRTVLNEHPGRWFLEVRASNRAARNLYKTLGFEEIGERRGYYADPPETAIVMTIRS